MKRRPGPSELLDTLHDKRNLLIVTHDNPDPDAIAAGMALRALVETRLGLQAQLTFGGIVGRAENKAMVDALAVDITPLDEIDAGVFDAVALVDTQLGAGNHSLPQGLVPTVVIDHHQPRQPETDQCPFADVRNGYGATSTILVEYLRKLSVQIGPALATALFYGIKVDTQDLGRHASRADIDAYHHLFPLVDKRLLPKIEYPRLPHAYFETFHSAMEQANVYDKVVVTELDRVQNPNAVAEVADLLLRLEGMVWSGCFGFFGDQLYISIRTSDPEGNAYDVIARMMTRAGTRGGHGQLAGGRVDITGQSVEDQLRLRARLAASFLKVLGVPEATRAAPLLRVERRVHSRTAKS